MRALTAVAISALARVEVPAAIWRKHRIGELDLDDATVLVRAFEADYHGSGAQPPRFATVAVSASMLDAAAELVAIHGLRAYDGVQLASALAARAADPECATFACFDHGLSTAAARQGLELVPG